MPNFNQGFNQGQGFNQNFNQGQGFNQNQGFNSNFNGQPNGQFNGSYQNDNNNGGNKGAYNNHIKVQLLAYLAKDPESNPVGQAKVATVPVAINHKGQNGETDFWNLEIWVNQGQSSAVHDFLMDYCKKGRQVFVEGVPYLKRRKRQVNGQDVLDQNGKPIYDFYPTIRVSNLIATSGGSHHNGQQNTSNSQNHFNNGNQSNDNFGGQLNSQYGAPNGNFGAPVNSQPNGQFQAPNANFGTSAGQFQAPNNPFQGAAVAR